MSEEVKYTPMMMQYLEEKKKYGYDSETSS